MGAWEDNTWGWAAKFDPVQYDFINRDPESFSVPGSENYSAVLRRFLPALREIAEAHEGGTVAVFSHGSAIRIVLSELLGYGSTGIAKIPYCDNTSVAELEYESGNLRPLSYNDNSHLPPEMSAFSRDTWWKNADFQDGRDLYFLPMDVRSDPGGKSYLRRYRETWVISHGTDVGFTDQYLLRARSNAAADPKTVMEAFREGVPCGMVELSPLKKAEEGAGHISLLYLEKDFRHMGLGVQLLGQAHSYYKKLGRRYLRLCVADTNDDARSFYVRWGFREASREEGMFGDILILTKDIS